MAITTPVKLPTKAPALQTLAQGLFPNGVITLINESNLAKTALKEATNIFLYENGAPGPRWGVNWYGSPLPNAPAAIDGGFMYQANNGGIHALAIAGGLIYRSIDNLQSWTLCTGATLTAGNKVYGVQANSSTASNNFFYLVNGNDNIVRYDGTTTLQSYTPLTQPGSLAATQTGLPGTAYTYYYRVAAVNSIGSTQASVTASVQVGVLRGSWDPTNTGTKYVSLTWGAVAGAIRYDVYVANNASDDASNNLLYIDSVGNNSYTDNGSAFANPNSVAPIQNTTSGPVLGEMTLVGSRIFGTRDKNNPYRVWFSGSGAYLGYFSDAYDGGYIDLQRGSQFFPTHVEDYRDGKGTPLSTIWCKSSDGRGCVWQMSLDTATDRGQNYTQPNANKLPGSRGTDAPNSVVNVLNDYMFFNYQAIYNLGSRAQFLNLLSTDESSANIRPTLTQQIKPSAGSNTAAYYFKAKVFISASFNSDTNSNCTIYDTERKSWIPNAYTFGMERFFQYTDSISKTQHLLFWKPGDSQFSETSENITGDYGQPFATSLTTGLISVDKTNRFAFMYVEEAEVEFASIQGPINIELIGIERNKGYSTQKSATIVPAATASNVGWSTFPWSAEPWTYAGNVQQVYAESSTKRYFNVQRDLNAYQWHITTNSNPSAYVLRALQIQGTPTDGGMPRQWRLQTH